MIFDIFCSVDGNRDRWALCWRLARDLVQREHTVRLWIDDEHARRYIAVYEVGYFPMYAEDSAQWYGDTSADRGSLDRRGKVQVRPWPAAGKWLLKRRTPDVIVEAFECGLPETVVTEIGRLPKPPICVALKSFSTATQSYPKKSNAPAGLSKLQAMPVHALNAGLTKDGVLWCSGSESGVFDVAKWRTAFVEGWLRRPLGPGERLISMCASTNPQALRDFYALLEQDSVPSVILSPECDPVNARDWAFGIEPGPRIRSLGVGPLSQDAFDDLLKGCDVNFVCGEDAVTRAWASGRPWIWQELSSARSKGADESGDLLHMLDAPARLLNLHAWWNGRPHTMPKVGDFFDQSLWPDVLGLKRQDDLVAGLLAMLSPLVDDDLATKKKRAVRTAITSKEGRELLPPGAGYRIRGEEIEGKTLTIGMGTYVDFLHETLLRNCELRIIKTTRQSLNFKATFDGCDIRPKTTLKHKQMRDNVFLHCNFRGHYVGCQFGSHLEKGPGRAEDCDFLACKLHLTAFFDCELSRLKLPGWPHIYLVRDSCGSWAEEWAKASISLPPPLALIHELESRREESILAVHLPDFELDPEEVWPLIQDMRSVWFPGRSDKPRASVEVASLLAKRNAAVKLQNKQDIERVSVWNLLHRSWLSRIQRQPDGSLELLFDTSFFKAKVPDAPEKVLVRLKEGAAIHRHADEASEVREAGEIIEKFMLMGLGREGDDIILKPHRKERGQIKLSYASYEVFDGHGTPLESDELSRVARNYWMASS
jgi:hypothetical protein